MGDLEDGFGIARVRVQQLDVTRLGSQTRAVTSGAGGGLLVAGQFFAHRAGIGFFEASLKVGDDAFKRMLALDLALLAAGAVGLVGELDLFVTRAIQKHLLYMRRQLLKGLFNVHLVMASQALDEAVGIGVAAIPTLHRPAAHAQRREGHHTLRIKGDDMTQTIARRARALWRVEGKQPWL